jgi:hypothetical protein
MIRSIPWNGERIGVAGLYAGIPLAQYHGDLCVGPSVSSSPLRVLWDKSPAHAWARCGINPERIVEDDNEAFVLGRAAHFLICGEVGFSDQFAVQPDWLDGAAWHGNRKACREWKRAQQRAGKTVLTNSMIDAIKGMALALGANPLVQSGILNGQIERSMIWKDQETGIWLKARPDVIPSDSGDFGDLKTTTSVVYRDLQASLGNYGYCQQAGLVFEGAKALDMEATSFSLIWVEKTPPHCVRVTTLRDEDIARGAKMNRAALRTFADCLSNGHWPGPGDDRADAEFIDLAQWRRDQIDERLKLHLREAA